MFYFNTAFLLCGAEIPMHFGIGLWDAVVIKHGKHDLKMINITINISGHLLIQYPSSNWDHMTVYFTHAYHSFLYQYYYACYRPPSAVYI